MVLLFVIMSLSIITNAQDGVKFEDLTFEQALAKAKVENKLVFMDCYTSWCGPVSYTHMTMTTTCDL